MAGSRRGDLWRATPGPDGRGLLLASAKLALDCAVPGATTVVSHAHGDHVPSPPFAADATEATAAIADARIRARLAPGEPAPEVGWRVRAYGEPFAAGAATVTLHPSGHVLGGALVEVAFAGERLLYTGDFQLRAPASCPALDASRLGAIDVLVTESTFGLPIFRFPPTGISGDALARFARDSFAEGAVPVVLGWSLGKAQEVAKLLGERGVATVLHGAAWRALALYAALGIRFPAARAYDGTVREGEALVVPPDARTHPMVTRLPERRLALASGWARLERSRFSHDAEGLVDLSDHADHFDLLRFARDLSPARVVVNHGYAEEFAHALRSEGFHATALAGAEDAPE